MVTHHQERFVGEVVFWKNKRFQIGKELNHLNIFICNLGLWQIYFFSMMVDNDFLNGNGFRAFAGPGLFH